MTTQIYNAELARLLAPSAVTTQPTLQDIINFGAVSLDGLSDVVITYPPLVGQYLRYSTYAPTYNYWTNVPSSYLGVDLVGTFQPYDNTLTQLAAYNSNGLITQTAADTFTGRTIVEGSGIEVTNGNGVSGNPIITQKDLISPFLAIPGLVGFWPMSSVQRSTGNAYDISGQGRTMTNALLGSVYFGNDVLIPYYEITAGTGRYFYRPDETDLDILGTETTYAAAARGLTMGAWVYINDFDNTLGSILCKSDGASNCSYDLDFFSSVANQGNVNFRVYGTGAVASPIEIDSSVTLNELQWYFIVGRYDPSTEVAIFVNGTKSVNTTSVPASIFNSNARLEIGRTQMNDNFIFEGRMSLVFLSANYITDAAISNLFEQTRYIFGV